MYYLSSVFGVGILIFKFLFLALFCDNVLTGKTALYGTLVKIKVIKYRACCSKLRTLLVKVSLKFQMFMSNIRQNFC